ncbi:MAG: hypothetical protein GX180_03380, partial [Enterococcus sp.]|nr:hypothetical protein [Enterococcus sp.]
MNKKYKWGLVFLTGLFSVVIIFLGSQMTRGQAQEERNIPKTTVQSEQVKLDRLSDQLENLFVDTQAGFLKPEVTQIEVEELKKEAAKLVDFSKDKEATAYTEKRRTLQQAIVEVRIQIDVQEQLNELFEEVITDFQIIEDTYILNSAATENQLEKLAETLAQYSVTNQWHENVVAYQAQAQKQWDAIDAIQVAIKAFAEQSASITQADFDNLTIKISQVLSSEWQTVLSEQLAQLTITPIEAVIETSDTQTSESSTTTNNNQTNQNNNYYTPTTPVTPTPTPTPDPTPTPTPTPDPT